MGRRIKETLTSVCVVGFLLVTTSCSSRESGEGDADRSVAAVQSPLAEYLNLASGAKLSPVEQERRAREFAFRQQELIAQCMLDAGFHYIPTLANWNFGPTRHYDLRLDDRDWVMQWGYGIIDSPIGGVYPSEVPLREINPNLEIQNQLSVAETRAYWETLIGPPCPMDTFTCPELAKLGCRGRVDIELPRALLWSDEFLPLQTAIDAMEASLNSSEQIIQVNNEWAYCMADSGFGGFSTQSEARTSILNQLNAMWPMVSNGLPRVKELQVQEIELALADLNCRETIDFSARTAAARFAIETTFVSDHRSALDAFRAAAEQRQADFGWE